MSYGKLVQVAAFAKIYTRDGSFYDYSAGPPVVKATNPSSTEVTQWLADISALVDSALANAWFETPIDNTDAPQVYTAVANRVCVLVADLCAFANQKGRLFTDRVVEVGPLNVINKELVGWVNDNSVGFENLGAAKISQSGSARAESYSVKMTRQTE